MIYKWTSMTAFNTWHEAIKAVLGIPDGLTLEYTEALKVTNSDIRAFVRESEANLFPDLIGIPSEPIIKETIA